MFLLLLLLSSTGESQAQLVSGQQKDGTCVCPVNSSMWTFPVLRYEAVLQLVETCNNSMNKLHKQVEVSSARLPGLQALLQNLTDRLTPFTYLNDMGVYSDLALRQLGAELQKLETDIGSLHAEKQSAETRKLTEEVVKLQKDVKRMHVLDNINMGTVKHKLRYLKNRAESCRSIPKDFRGTQSHCLKGLMSNISTPVMTKTSSFGKSYASGSWGKQAMWNSSVEKESYWVQPLVSSNAWGNTIRLYSTYEDFMASARQRDLVFAPSNSHANAIEGPSGVLYGEGFYYHCYGSAAICRFDLQDKTVARATLPGTGVGISNKFPYCYYDCRGYSDVDLEADETGLWALYTTLGNHGNLVASRLGWDGKALNVTHTWETRLFKKAVSNAFVACGVLYATRHVDNVREEVFYAFDTGTGREDISLALPLEKVAKGVASLSYNPADKHIYMYNDGYLLSYQAQF
ncbi:olfactomedin-4 [Polymixia lowei]